MSPEIPTRHRGSSDREESVTSVPCKASNGSWAVESSPMPKTNGFSSISKNTHADDDQDVFKTVEQQGNGPRKAMSEIAVRKDESRSKKIMIRVVSGAAMIGVFLSCLFMGHIYICLLVALVELLLFRELVKVRYHAFFNTIQDTIPLFRTTQWIWFCVAIFYAYGDFVGEVISNNQDLHHLLAFSQFSALLSFTLYSATLVLTIATIQTAHIKFQINQLCWTILVLCLTIGQMKYIMHNVFNGLFWFALPILLVVTNDIMAYACGMSFGRKFIRHPFITFSPNKTWEGFIGGGVFTILTSWSLSRFLAQFTWMTCPTNEFRLYPKSLDCVLHPVFVEAQYTFTPQLLSLLPSTVMRAFPGVVEICSDVETGALAQCGSAALEIHDHFELVLTNVYPIQFHALLLALFASLVAPFGGFLASAIKRAYGIKDFDSLIPGHGGMMDRMDCQFLMALCTWVHYNTFVSMATVSVPKLIYLFNMMGPSQQQQFLKYVNSQSR